jgi:hypothetical protein
MTPVFTIHGRGTVRLTICLGPWALKLARNARGASLQSFRSRFMGQDHLETA